MKARELVKMEYGNSHCFMTPHIISYGWVVKDKVAYELSRNGTKGKRIYGLSVVEWNGTTSKRRSDLCNIFDNRDEIKQYIKQLKGI